MSMYISVTYSVTCLHLSTVTTPLMYTSHPHPHTPHSHPTQILILDKALALHKQCIDPSLQGLHSKLEKCFEEIQEMVFPDRRRPVRQSQSVMVSVVYMEIVQRLFKGLT